MRPSLWAHRADINRSHTPEQQRPLRSGDRHRRGPERSEDEPILERVADGRQTDGAIGFIVQRGSSIETALFTRQAAPNAPGSWSIAQGQTDARNLCCHDGKSPTAAGKGAR